VFKLHVLSGKIQIFITQEVAIKKNVIKLV